MTRAISVVLLFVIAPIAFAAAPEGIPRELARQRAAAISDVRYQLSFTLGHKASTTAGRETP